MKLLSDQNISYRITKKVKAHFPGCLHVSDCGLQDHEHADIGEYARNNELVIVTYDSDFFDISLLKGHPPKIIWIRAGNLTTEEVAQLIVDNKETINNFLTKEEFKKIACIEID